MSYRCELCQAVSKPGQQLLRHPILRHLAGRTEIARELDVCPKCLKALSTGADPSTLVRRREDRAKPVAVPAPVHKAKPVVLTGRYVVTPKKGGL